MKSRRIRRRKFKFNFPLALTLAIVAITAFSFGLGAYVSHASVTLNGSGVTATSSSGNFLDLTSGSSTLFAVDGSGNVGANEFYGSTVSTTRYPNLSFTNAGGLNINAGGTNQNITLTPSGNGSVVAGTGILANGCPVVSTPSYICVKAAPYYASGSLATTTTASPVNAGATSAILADASSFQVGQGILITGAGTSGVADGDYLGTITGIDGNTVTFTPATRTSVASGTNVQHDDTSAIQSAINAVSSVGGGTLYFPSGHYRVNGPFQNTGEAPTTGADSILMLPAIPWVTSPPQPGVTISFVGNGGIFPGGDGGTIIQTSRGHSGNLIGAYAPTSGVGNMSNVELAVDGVLFRSYNDPAITMVNAYSMAGLRFGSVIFDVGLSPVCGYNGIGGCTITPPDHPGVSAVITPGASNYGQVVANNLWIYGYYHGIWLTEHEDIKSLYCVYTHTCISGGVGLGYHPAHIGRVEMEHTVVGIDSSTGIGMHLIIDEAAGETVTTFLNDPGNLLYGKMNYYYPAGFTEVGGANFSVTDLNHLSSNLNGPITTLTGTTAGNLYWSQPVQGSSYKKTILNFQGFENTSSTAQTVTFPTAFSYAPSVVGCTLPTGITISTTGMSAASMSVAFTGQCIVEGQ